MPSPRCVLVPQDPALSGFPQKVTRLSLGPCDYAAGASVRAGVRQRARGLFLSWCRRQFRRAKPEGTSAVGTDFSRLITYLSPVVGLFFLPAPQVVLYTSNALATCSLVHSTQTRVSTPSCTAQCSEPNREPAPQSLGLVGAEMLKKNDHSLSFLTPHSEVTTDECVLFQALHS